MEWEATWESFHNSKVIQLDITVHTSRIDCYLRLRERMGGWVPAL